MNTNFILTTNSPLRTTLINEVTKQPVFRIDTPRAISRRSTKIYRLLPSTITNDAGTQHAVLSEDAGWSDSDDASEREVPRDDEVPEDVDPSSLEDNEIARIYWHYFSPHRIIFERKIRTRSELLPTAGTGKRSFGFTVNGLKYLWDMGSFGKSVPKLVLDEGSKTLIAKFHRKNLVFNKRRAYLEITPAGLEIIDYIILTFVFVEQKRRERNR